MAVTDNEILYGLFAGTIYSIIKTGSCVTIFSSHSKTGMFENISHLSQKISLLYISDEDVLKTSVLLLPQKIKKKKDKIIRVLLIILYLLSSGSI